MRIHITSWANLIYSQPCCFAGNSLLVIMTVLNKVYCGQTTAFRYQMHHDFHILKIRFSLFSLWSILLYKIKWMFLIVIFAFWLVTRSVFIDISLFYYIMEVIPNNFTLILLYRETYHDFHILKMRVLFHPFISLSLSCCTKRMAAIFSFLLSDQVSFWL